MGFKALEQGDACSDRCFEMLGSLRFLLRVVNTGVSKEDQKRQAEGSKGVGKGVAGRPPTRYLFLSMVLFWRLSALSKGRT